MPRSRRSQTFNIIVQGRRTTVSPALRAYVEEKLGKLQRYLDQIQEAQVVLSVGKDRQVGRAHLAEVTVWGDGVVLRGAHSSEDMHVSVDAVVEKLEKQIGKYRSRLIEKRRIDASRTRRRRDVQAAVALRKVEQATVEMPGLPKEIVRTKRFAMKPMTAEDALMQMELLGHDFFVFRNTQTQEVNVLYRRKSGDYGLIEPE